MDKKEIYKTYVKDVYKYSYFKLKNKELAEDATSETFVRFFESKYYIEINTLENIKGYIIGITRNIISDTFKENKYKVIDLSSVEETVSEEFNDVETKEINKELLTFLKKELYLLNSQDSEIIVLRIWEDLKFNEIAKLLKQNENKIKAIYYRSINLLTTKLNSRKDLKLNSISLSLIVSSLVLIPQSNEFKFSFRLTVLLNNILSLNLSPVNNPVQKFIAKGVLAKASIISTTSVKLIAIASSLLVVVGVVGTSLIINNHNGVKQQTNTSISNNPLSYTNISSSQNLIKVGLDLNFGNKIDHAPKYLNYTLKSGAYLDQNYKAIFTHTSNATTYDISDSEILAEFSLQNTVYPYGDLKEIVDLGKVTNFGNLKRLQAPLNNEDLNIRYYTNRGIEYNAIPGYPKPPITYPYISSDPTHPAAGVIASCKPVLGNSYATCDNLMKSLTFIYNTSSKT